MELTTVMALEGMDGCNFTDLEDPCSVTWNLTIGNETEFPNASANATELPRENQFIMPAWEQALWTLLFAGMVLVAAGGNLIVIWIVLAHRRMRTVTNYFIVNLAVADTIVSTLNVIFSFVYMLNSHWPFGWTYCKICQFVAVLSVAGSVFTLVAIALDRSVEDFLFFERSEFGLRAPSCERHTSSVDRELLDKKERRMDREDFHRSSLLLCVVAKPVANPCAHLTLASLLSDTTLTKRPPPSGFGTSWTYP